MAAYTHTAKMQYRTTQAGVADTHKNRSRNIPSHRKKGWKMAPRGRVGPPDYVPSIPTRAMTSTASRSRLAVRAVAAVAAAISAVVLTTATPAYAAYCKQWMFNGTYFFMQSNNLALVFYGFNRTPSGTAATISGPITRMRGPVTGRLDGNYIYMRVKWDNGSVGTYEGNVDAGGRARGITYNSADSSYNANWKSDKGFLCTESN